ncbi:MAG TPA: fibronectin type III domain-containing protein [Terriglobia bacterium]|nr:fibronectin type III domain-containing protein [Terriglobia bacterium]
MIRRIFAICFVMVVMPAAMALGQVLPRPKVQAVAGNSNGGVDGSVAPVTGATGYRFTLKDPAGLVVATQTTASPQASFGGLPANSLLTLTVAATNSTSASPDSDPATALTAPAAPTGITGLGGKNKVTVSWAAAPGAASYQLTLSNGQSFTTASTSYIVGNLPTATSYNAIVASINSAGLRGSFSAAVSVRTANIAE